MKSEKRMYFSMDMELIVQIQRKRKRRIREIGKVMRGRTGTAKKTGEKRRNIKHEERWRRMIRGEKRKIWAKG